MTGPGGAVGDLDELLQLAQVATSGPWVRDGSAIWQAGDEGENVVGSVPRGGTRISEADAAFIAAANPSAVAALVGRVREAEAELAVMTR